MTKSYRHIYLSPHYDDAALSCGGTIHRLTQAGEPVLVVTVCAAPPPASACLSTFAQAQHARWDQPDDVIALRQAEDQAAMEILGADYLWLNFPDCIYRSKLPNGPWFYNNDAELFGEVHPDDEMLAEQIVESLKQQIGAKDDPVIYAPLTVGHHVDHQLVHAATWQLYHQGRAVMFYEDYPYVATNKYGNATLTDTLARLENQQRPVKSGLHFFFETDLKAKVDSINAYASQIETLFGRRAGAAELTRQYALRVGGGQAAERFWTPR